jgi:hypothetical protein
MTKMLAIGLMTMALALAACAGGGDPGTPDGADDGAEETLSLVIGPTPTPYPVPHYCFNFCSKQTCQLDCFNGYINCLYGYGYNTPETSAICNEDLQQCNSGCSLCCNP